LGPLDVSLLNASKQLDRIPPNLFSGLEDEPESNNLCPLDDTAPNDIRIDFAIILDTRLRDIQDRGPNSNSTPSPFTPEIRVESDPVETPDIALSPTDPTAQPSKVHKTLLQSKTYGSINAHHKHLSALLRLLYLHSCINPGNHSPHIPSLLLPLYRVLLQEIDPQDLAHVEADTFWLFEAMIGEFSELEDEEGGSLWMKRFSERLAWADEELSLNLVKYTISRSGLNLFIATLQHAKGLDPALPHYS
jgi:hypothetical protein